MIILHTKGTTLYNKAPFIFKNARLGVFVQRMDQKYHQVSSSAGRMIFILQQTTQRSTSSNNELKEQQVRQCIVAKEERRAIILIRISEKKNLKSSPNSLSNDCFKW